MSHALFYSFIAVQLYAIQKSSLVVFGSLQFWLICAQIWDFAGALDYYFYFLTSQYLMNASQITDTESLWW